MRTCILPPPRTIGTYAGTLPSTSARHSSTSARWRSIVRCLGRWTAPAAITMAVRYHLPALRALRGLLVAAVVLVAARADAHPVPFSFLDLHVERDAIDATLVAHIFDLAHDLNVDPPER